MINRTKYFLSNTKIFMDVIFNDVDSMTYYANKTIQFIENHKS